MKVIIIKVIISVKSYILHWFQNSKLVSFSRENKKRTLKESSKLDNERRNKDENRICIIPIFFYTFLFQKDIFLAQ